MVPRQIEVLALIIGSLCYEAASAAPWIIPGNDLARELALVLGELQAEGAVLLEVGKPDLAGQDIFVADLSYN